MSAFYVSIYLFVCRLHSWDKQFKILSFFKMQKKMCWVVLITNYFKMIQETYLTYISTIRFLIWWYIYLYENIKLHKRHWHINASYQRINIHVCDVLVRERLLLVYIRETEIISHRVQSVPMFFCYYFRDKIRMCEQGALWLSLYTLLWLFMIINHCH